MLEFSAITVPIIVAMVYTLITILKIIVKNNPKVMRVIPIIACSLGTLLAVFCHFLIPEIMPTQNIFLSIFLGSSSGLAATGTHQIFKQLSKEK